MQRNGEKAERGVGAERLRGSGSFPIGPQRERESDGQSLKGHASFSIGREGRPTAGLVGSATMTREEWRSLPNKEESCQS